MTQLFPVGHYIGRHRDDSHLVRVGGNGVELRSEATLRIWQLCHGLMTDQAPTTRAALLSRARTAGIVDAEPILDGLVRTGVVAAVDTGAAAAKRFATAYRLKPLLTGLPELPPRSDTYRLGLAGRPAVTVDEWSRLVWVWAPLVPHLWELAVECSAMSAPSAESDAVHSSEEIVDDVVAAVRTLLANGAAYLDVAAGSQPDLR